MFNQDLIDEVQILEEDLALWCRVVAKIEPESTRFNYYVQAWNVADKIKREKLAGNWPPLPNP